MNNLSLASILSLPLALVLAWQLRQVDASQTALGRVETRIAAATAQINELNRAVQEAKQQLKGAEAKARAAGRAPAAVPAPETVTGPTEGELGWENGKDWIWFEKRLLTEVGISSLSADYHRFQQAEIDTSQLSTGGQKLLERFIRDCLSRPGALPPGEAARMTEDAPTFFRSWAAKEPAGAVKEVVELLARMEDETSVQNPPIAFKVNTTAASLLGVNHAEVTRLQELINEFTARAQELERSHIEFIPPSDIKDEKPNKLGLKITAFPDEGARLKEEYLGRFQAILGQERGRYWMEMATPTFNYEFAGLGKDERKITLASDGKRYHAQQFKGANGPSTYTGFGTPYLDFWWRPLIRKTATGFEFVR